MYSNNQPGKEGALLYKDRTQATSLALLYQRYRKFDKSCYTVENATFFNVFGTETVRIGRYKVPQTDEIILCTTDPLTYTDMMRYFRSFAPVKYFRSQFMQQKRKRQYVLNTRESGVAEVEGNSDLPSDPEFFFQRTVQLIEYGLFDENKGKVDTTSTLKLPILALSRSLKDMMLSSISTSGPIGQTRISLPLYKANSQYFFEQLFQGILNNLKKSNPLYESTIMIGGDGRMLNNFAVGTFLAIAAGNRVKEVKIATNNIISYPAAKLTAEEERIDVTIVLSDPVNPAGLNGYFGMQLLDSSGDTYSKLAYCDLIEDVAKVSEVSKVLRRGVNHETKITFGGEASLNNYFSALKKKYDLSELRKQLSTSNLIIAFDCLHGSFVSPVSMLLKELNLLNRVDDSDNANDDNCIALLLNDERRSDYFGKLPGRPVDSLELFNRLTGPDVIDLPRLKTNILTSQGKCGTSDECFLHTFSAGISSSSPKDENEDSGCPDFGFIYNSDGSSCDMITASHGIISASEIRALTETDETCHDALVLTIDILNKIMSKRDTNLDHMIQRYRKQNGKSYLLKLTLPEMPIDMWNQFNNSMVSRKRRKRESNRPFKTYFPSYKSKIKIDVDDDISDPDNISENEKGEIKMSKRLVEVTETVDIHFDEDSESYLLKFPSYKSTLRVHKSKERESDKMCDIDIELERVDYGTTNINVTSLLSPLASIAIGLMLPADIMDSEITTIVDKIIRR